MQQAQIMWRPSKDTIQATQMARFAASAGFDAEDYDAMHRWSVADPAAFWSAVWSFANLSGDRGETAFVRDPEANMTGSRFFPEARVNLAENMLRGPGDEDVVLETNESGEVRAQLTRAELRFRVGHAQRTLSELGVAEGDRVAGILPNTAEALVYTLAALSIGAVWTSCAPEFGPQGVLDRFGQVDPRVLVVAERYVYNGKDHHLLDKAVGIAEELPNLGHVLVLGDTGEVTRAGAAQVHSADLLHDGVDKEPDFVRLPFDHPAYIVYTSGTTGLPKSIVHGTGGVLLNLVKEHLLHGDVRAGDRMLYYTNTAWMMYHWSIAALACGASVVLYDGAAIPDNDPSLLWRLTNDLDVTHFGTSPKYLSVMERQGVVPRDTFGLDALRAIFSAGAPLTEAHFSWVYSNVKSDLMLASISGGTEILGCFVLGNPTLPVRSGEIQCPALGMSVAALDQRQLPMVGRKGDLVCTEPFPSMPLRFWGEDGWERYQAAYFAVKPEVWFHGDLAELRPSGGVVISGRTDTTLKPGGVRIGTSEIYRVVEGIDGVSDSVVIGYPTEDDMEIWLFLVTADGKTVDPDDVRSRLRREASPRHVPARIFHVPQVPYTLAGKKVEGAVLKTVLGQEVRNRASLSNPEVLADFGQGNLDRHEVR